jgi:hypothetical protein
MVNMKVKQIPAKFLNNFRYILAMNNANFLVIIRSKIYRELVLLHHITEPIHHLSR